jgi:hypothetical protein
MTSPEVTPGFTVPAATARRVSSARASWIRKGGRGVAGPAEEQVRVARVIGEGRPEGAQQLLEPVPVGAGQRAVNRRQQLVQREAQELADQGVLAGKTAVDGADAHAGAGRDLLHAGLGTGLAEHLARGVQDAVVIADGFTPRGPDRALGGGSRPGGLTAHLRSSQAARAARYG